MTRRGRALALLAIALLFGLASQSALGYWNGTGEAGSGAAAAATMNQGAQPTATEEGPGSVTVSWEAGTLSNGVPVDGYVIQRYDEATGTLATTGPGCAGTLAALTCTEDEVPEGNWQYTVTPVLGANWRGLESPKSGGIATAALERAASRTAFGEAVATPPAEGTDATSEAPAAEGEGGAEGEATPETTTPTEGNPSSPVAPTTETTPTNSLSLTEPSGAYLSSETLYFDPDTAGSFLLGDALAGGTEPASVDYPSVEAAGWSHAAEAVTTPAGGPYVSSLFSWEAGAESPGSYAVTGEDSLGAATTTALTFVSDAAPPTGGAITYSAGPLRVPSVPITTSAGTDPLSGIDVESGSIQRDEATLDATTGTCGDFAGTFATTVTLIDGADTSVGNGHCYQYRYVISDNVGNPATYSSANVVEIETTGP